MKAFDAPIPGQSLTKEPRGQPWERPPETTDPDKAIVHHITRLSQPEMLDKILDAVNADMPVSLITDLMVTGGVAKGIHSIDISLMVAPIIHDYIVELLEEEGVEYKEFFEGDDEEENRKQIAVSKARDSVASDPRGISQMIKEEEKPEEEEIEEEKPERKSRGLMSRGDM